MHHTVGGPSSSAGTYILPVTATGPATASPVHESSTLPPAGSEAAKLIASAWMLDIEYDPWGTCDEPPASTSMPVTHGAPESAGPASELRPATLDELHASRATGASARSRMVTTPVPPRRAFSSPP